MKEKERKKKARWSVGHREAHVATPSCGVGWTQIQHCTAWRLFYGINQRKETHNFGSKHGWDVCH